MRGSRIFIGFSDRFAKSLSRAGSVRLDFPGDNRRGCSRNSNHSGHYYSTHRSVHNLGGKQPKTRLQLNLYMMDSIFLPHLPPPLASKRTMTKKQRRIGKSAKTN